MRISPIALSLLLSASTLAACSGEDPWWLGDEEPGCSDKCDSSNSPLTIFLSKEQTNVRKILSSESLGGLSRSRTGNMDIDGLGLTENTMLVYRGQLHRFDGVVEDHFFMVQPKFISHEQGAANPEGFLIADFKSDSIRSFAPGVEPLGTHAGIFKGEIVASNNLTLEDSLSDDLSELLIRPAKAFQRPPNYIKNAEIIINPIVVISELGPADSSCFGTDIVDTTLSHTDLRMKVEVDGFPKGEPVDVQVRYLVPESAAAGTLEHLSDFLTGLVGGDIDEDIETLTIADWQSDATASLPIYKTKESAWGDDYYSFEIEVQAFSGNQSIFTEAYIHSLMVVDEGDEAIVDVVDLCPAGDDACRELRDRNSAENIIARRNVIEFKAQSLGLYDTVTRPIGSCSGGDSVAGDFAEACVAYHEDSDSQISASLATELQFELHVNGEAQGEASWGGSLPGLGSAKVKGAFSASFKLDADFEASYETSTSWRDRNSMDVIYDPSNTQIQWWRVVTPRLRYLEFAEFNSCGKRISDNNIFLSDMRDSRLVLACEEVPSFDTVCHAVEPNSESVGACTQLLIDPASTQGQECSAE